MPPLAPLDRSPSTAPTQSQPTAPTTSRATVATTGGPSQAAVRDAARGQLPAPLRDNGQVRPFDNNKLRAKLAAPPRSQINALVASGKPVSAEALEDAHIDDLVTRLDIGVTRSTLNRQVRSAKAAEAAHLQAQLRTADVAVASVDFAAGRKNYRAAVAKLGPDVTPTAVIKANGYGEGAVEWAKVLIEEGCKDFFVARISEAVNLRRGLRAQFPEMADKVAINVLDGFIHGSDPQLLIDHKITPVLNSLEQVQEWNAVARDRQTELPAILQFDSGMNRAGMRTEELEALLQDQEGNMGHIGTQFIMSHLAKSDEATQRPDGSFQAGETSEKQLAKFNDIAKRFAFVKSSIGASSTVMLDKKFHKDYVRLGGAFHGQDPIDGALNPYTQVLSLHAKITELKRAVPTGSALGYGGRYVTTRPTDVAVLGIGYTDGPPRGLGAKPEEGNNAKMHVVIKGQDDDGKDVLFKCPMIAATSMDSSMIDVTDVPEKYRTTSTFATLIGDGITPNAYGAMYGTNPSETQVKLSSRVRMDYKDIDPEDKPKLDTTPSANVWAA